MARLRTNSMNFYVELDERGVLIHNTLLLFPKNSHLVITRQLAKGKIGSVRIRTDSEDGWKEMRVDDSLFAYRFDMDLPCSGPFFFVTSFIPATDQESQEPQEGPFIRFVVQNDIQLDGSAVGPSGLCIQSLLSGCMGDFNRWNDVLLDTFLCG
ncbi:hypothetical protein WA556_001273 [Blastocystis sp. ATCC 50177/Nand II]